VKKGYSLNSRNQLLISRGAGKKALAANGRFSIDNRNRLIYWLNEPQAWRRRYGLADKIIFEGKWRLGANHDLELVLDETREQLKGDCLALKADIVGVNKDGLTFQVKSRDREGQTRFQLLKLNGFWQADEANRINLAVTKKALPDTLVWEGAWQVNQNQQITYTYERVDLKTKTRAKQALTFEGYWQLNNANKLTYILFGEPQSRFDFRGQIESPNLYPREGKIKYRLGIGSKAGPGRKGRLICLYGAWKFSRKLGLNFEMDYGQGRRHNLEFAAEIFLANKNSITLMLKDKAGEPLGMSITFTRRLLSQSDAQAFLRLKKLQGESAVEAGIRLPF